VLLHYPEGVTAGRPCRFPLSAFALQLLASTGEMTFPWEVPKDTIVVEYIDGHWRVVPHGRAVEIFRTRDAAIARAWQIVALYLQPWRILEKTPEGIREVRAA
jgi:hypothetical protein